MDLRSRIHYIDLKSAEAVRLSLSAGI